VVAEMRFLRGMKGKNKRAEINYKNLKLNILEGKLRSNRRRWYRHIL
jgi:hypothetical protein